MTMEILLSIIASGLLTGLFTYMLLRQKHALESAKISGEIKMLKTENDRITSSNDKLRSEFNSIIDNQVNKKIKYYENRNLYITAGIVMGVTTFHMILLTYMYM